jgi:hypothetical protein
VSTANDKEDSFRENCGGWKKVSPIVSLAGRGRLKSPALGDSEAGLLVGTGQPGPTYPRNGNKFDRQCFQDEDSSKY